MTGSWIIEVRRRGSGDILHRQEGLNLKQVSKSFVAAMKGNLEYRDHPRRTMVLVWCDSQQSV